MQDLDGTWHDNATCKRCRFRHPPAWSCRYAGEVAAHWRKTSSSAFVYLAHSAAIEPDPEQDAWEFFIQENYDEPR